MMSLTSAVSRARVRREEPFVLPDPDFALLVAEKMRSQGSVYLRVSGGSMVPWIRAGDFVLVRQVDFAKVAVGDVIVFRRNGLVVTHRAIRRVDAAPPEKTAILLITKGDALDESDAPVSTAEFLGRATRIHRGRRHIDLDSFTHIFWGRVLARFSQVSRLIYGPLRFGKQLFLL
jgi:signal peptidase I